MKPLPFSLVVGIAVTGVVLAYTTHIQGWLLLTGLALLADLSVEVYRAWQNWPKRYERGRK